MTEAGPPSSETDERARGAVGRVIAQRYRIDELIAVGGMGAVYRAEHVQLRKRVAVKLLRPEAEGFPELVARFEREAIAGAHIAHPNVAAATDYGTLEDGTCFLVLELVRGRTLAAAIAEEGPMPEPRALSIVRQLAAALEAVHAMGIIHRDLKPRNVMLLESGGVSVPPPSTLGAKASSAPRDVVKLIDFGLAKVPVERLSTVGGEGGGSPRVLTGMGIVFGTVAYLAPEAALGMEAVDERSDLYALGVMLYEMLAGVRPFEAEEPAKLFRAHRLEPVPALAERAPGISVSPELEAIVRRLLAKDKAERFQSATELAAALEKASAETRAASGGALPPSSGHETGGGSRPPGAGERPRREPGASRSMRLVGGGAAGLLVLAGIAVFATRGDAPETGAPVASVAAEAALAPGASASPASLAATLEQAAGSSGDASAGARALLALVESDPAALRRAETRAAALAVALRPLDEDTRRVLFEALSSRAGAEGIDVLYDVAHASGGQGEAAEKARALLSDPAVRGRASADVRLALEITRASCHGKRLLFDRAAKDGGRRTLDLLERLRAVPCKRQRDACCFAHSPAMARALKALRGRSGSP